MTKSSLLAAALLALAAFSASHLHASTPSFYDEEQVKPDDGDTGDGGGDEKKPEEKKDPNDIRGTIGNLSLVRGLGKMARPAKEGLWEKLVNQPYYTPAVRARKLLFFGQYPEAEGKFRLLLEEKPGDQNFLEGYLEAILRQGRSRDVERFSEKVAALTDAQRGTTRLTRLRAEALMMIGKNDEARKLLGDFVAAHPLSKTADGELLTLYTTYGRVLEDIGEYAAAASVYTQLAPLAVGELPKDAQSATQIALALDRASVLTGSGKDKHRSVLYDLGQIEERDQTYWPAKLVEAQILLASHNVKEGTDAITEVLDLNPNETRARFLEMDYAIDGYHFEIAQAQLDEIKDRSDLAELDAGEGRLLLKERLPEKAVAPLLKAIAKNPNLPRARGWLAGAYYLLNQPDKMQEQLAAIKIANGASEHPVALFEAGEILRDARQFTEAEKLYKQSEAAAKWWSEPASALAELYLETGQEDLAKASYEKSFEIDPYNMRAFNQMKLLETLQGFAMLPSQSRFRPGSDLPAFVIRFDPKDEVLGHLAVEWMEKVRPEIWSYFQVTELPATTQIELFPSHEQFGVRTTGLPWIGTVGACTGNVIAMDVPRGGSKDLMGNFDWARVLRHEYTHVVTLAMTNNRIPHWLTEAAACEQEQAPRDWENCQLLASNFRAGTLFKIADLNWGFIRPKRSIDRQLAYMQSQWLYEYLVAQYGLPKMLDFLHCFRDGLTEPKAWEKAYGKSMPAMDTEFLAWAKTQIDGWGLPSDPLPKRPELEAALEKDPKDVESLMKLAWLMASSGDGVGARAKLEKVIELSPKHIKARELLGAVLSQSKNQADHDVAKTMLEGVVNEDGAHPVALRTLGVLAMAANDYDSAKIWFEKLQEVRPLEDTSYANLAGIYLVKKENDKAIGQLLELERHEQKDERIPRKLAQLFMDEGKLGEAEGAAYRAIRINPYNAINHEIMAQVIMAEKQPARAVEYWSDATRLQPKVAEFWEGLAEAKGQSGDVKAASDAAKKAMELAPDSAAKKWIQ